MEAAKAKASVKSAPFTIQDISDKEHLHDRVSLLHYGDGSQTTDLGNIDLELSVDDISEGVMEVLDCYNSKLLKLLKILRYSTVKLLVTDLSKNKDIIEARIEQAKANRDTEHDEFNSPMESSKDLYSDNSYESDLYSLHQLNAIIDFLNKKIDEHESKKSNLNPNGFRVTSMLVSDLDIVELISEVYGNIVVYSDKASMPKCIQNRITDMSKYFYIQM